MQKLRMMKEILPDMTVRQAHDLFVRILKQYTYEPFIRYTSHDYIEYFANSTT